METSKDVFKNKLISKKNPAEIKAAAYILTHKETKMFYIGSTINGGTRDNRHISELRKGIHSVKKLQELYVESPEFEFKHFILGDKLTPDIERKVREEEQKLLDLNSTNPLCLNTAKDSVASFRGLRHTDETKKKMSISATGHAVSDKVLAQLKEYNANKVITDEWREKLKASHSTEEAIKNRYAASIPKMKAVSINGCLYESQIEASRQLDINLCTLRQRLKSNTITWKDWYNV